MLCSHGITKTCLYNFDPHKPHFYIVKLGFTGVYIIFLISGQNIDCGYTLELPHRGGSNEYLQSMFWAEIKKYQNFSSENFHLLVVKFSIYLNRHVFVMNWIPPPTGFKPMTSSANAGSTNHSSTWRLLELHSIRALVKWNDFYHISELMLAKLIQRSDNMNLIGATYIRASKLSSHAS